MHTCSRGLTLLILVAISNCAMILVSSDFANDQMIPGDYGCDTFFGVDRDPAKPSPPLFWMRPPEKTQSFVLLVDDMDQQNRIHWLVVDIPREVTFLTAGASGTEMPSGSIELTNSFGTVGYAGLCPMNETHLYRFRLFAMDHEHTFLTLPEDSKTLTSDFITTQIMGNNLYCAVLSGNYYAPMGCAFDVQPGQPCVRPQIPCPVEIKEGEECPCPGPNCPVGDFKIRYVKPSETLKPHGFSVYKNPTNEKVAETLCSRPNPENRAQTVLSTVPRPAIASIPAPNALVEDTPMTMQEKIRRHIRKEGMSPSDLEFDFVETGEGMEAELESEKKLGEEEWEEVWVQDDLVVSSPLGPEASQDSGERKCSIDRSGCKRIRRIKKYSMTLWSPGYATGINSTISPKFLCSGYHNKNDSIKTTSPPLAWRHSPSGTKSFVMVLDDVSPTLEDDEFGNILWMVSNIPADVSVIPEGATGTNSLPSGSLELVPFMAPCPRRRSIGMFRVRVFAIGQESVELKISSQPPIRSRIVEHQLQPLATAAIQMNLFP